MTTGDTTPPASPRAGEPADEPADERFAATAVTHMLVVADVGRSRDWYVHVLDASVYAEYGGTSVVLELLGTWLLLVTGGPPTPGKPDVTLAAPSATDVVQSQLIFRVDDCARTHALLAGRGATFLAPPQRNGAETRAFFRDPDGHLFEISSLEGASTAAEATG